MGKNVSHTASIALPSRFPDPAHSDSEGLVAIGGELEPDWLVDAYRHGIFPWPVCDDEPMLWWSPDPRGVMPLDGFQISSRLRRTLRSGRFEVSADRAFDRVLHGCSVGPGREEGTWLTPAMQAAYQEMHRLGIAHSVEAWHDGELAGGVYGLAIGGLFAAESMFHYRTDASKVALAHLVEHLNQRGYRLLDIQQWTAHTGRLGAVEVQRDVYLGQLQAAIDLPVTFGDTISVGNGVW